MMLEIKRTLDVEDSRMGENPRGAHNGCDVNKSVSSKEIFHALYVL